jgi:hypothetical protein
MMGAKPIKVLWLSNSNDNSTAGEVRGLRRPERMMAMLSEATGRDFELVMKLTWPSAGFPPAVERWMEREAPDIVWLNVATFPFAYESVPRRLERWFGRFGRPIRKASAAAAATPWLAYNPLFRGARRLAQMTIGGDAALSPQQVVANVSAGARVVARKEDRVLVIEGPRGRHDMYPSRRAARRAEAKRLWVHRELRALAEDLHCGYCGSDQPLTETMGEPTFQRDRFHSDAPSHELSARVDFEVLLEAVSPLVKDSPSDSIRAKL